MRCSTTRNGCVTWTSKSTTSGSPDRGYVPSPPQPGKVPTWELPTDLLLDPRGPAKRRISSTPLGPLIVSLDEGGHRHVLGMLMLIQDIAEIERRGALGVLLDLMGPVDYPSWFCDLDLSVKDTRLDQWITPAGIRTYLTDHGWALVTPPPEGAHSEIWDPPQAVGTGNPPASTRTGVYLRVDGRYPRQTTWSTS